MSTVSQESGFDDEYKFGPHEDNVSKAAERLAVRKLIAALLENDASSFDRLTRTPLSEKSPEDLTEIECVIPFAIKQIKEDQEACSSFPPISLDPNNDFFDSSVSSKLDGEHDELLRISCELDFPELVLVDGKLVLDEVAEAKRIKAQKDSGYPEKKRRHEERSAEFAKKVRSQRLLGGISAAAKRVWKEWEEEYPRLSTSHTNQRARAFLKNHFSHASDEDEICSDGEPPTREEFEQWKKSVTAKLPSGVAAPQFRYFLENPLVSFDEYQAGEDPSSNRPLTTSKNNESTAKMLARLKKSLKKASDNECTLDVDRGKLLIKMTVKNRFSSFVGKRNRN